MSNQIKYCQIFAEDSNIYKTYMFFSQCDTVDIGGSL